MAKNQTNVSQWVDDRLALLDAGDWQPDPERGREQLRARRRTAYRRRIEWIVGSVTGLAACVLLTMFFSPGACARPNGCTASLSKSVGPTVQVPSSQVDYKEIGSPTAPITCEIYTDYECPSCALLYRDTIPVLMEQYVRTGKVKLLHRDFPLAQHPYSRIAARYANAAGSIGRYEVVVNQIFRTQSIWGRDGNVEQQVAQVLAPGEMQAVRKLVANDPHLDDSVEADRSMGAGDHVDRTPTLVLVTGGKRQAIAGVPQYSMLQAYLDHLLSLH